MYKRQRILLSILLEAKDAYVEDDLSYCVALVSKMTAVGSDSSFYDLVPGDRPRSLMLEHDVESLVRKGFIKLEKEFSSFEVTLEGKKKAFELAFSEMKEIVNVIESIKSLNKKELKIRTKEKIPELFFKRQGSVAKNEIYTIGYEGGTVDRFLNKIIESGIKGIIDVRNKPVSRKFGFSKNTLKKICLNNKIQYSHYPTLGIPGSQRSSLKKHSDYQELLDEYERTILKKTCSEQSEVLELLGKRPSALLCFEADHKICHRSRLAKALSAQSDFDITHL